MHSPRAQRLPVVALAMAADLPPRLFGPDLTVAFADLAAEPPPRQPVTDFLAPGPRRLLHEVEVLVTGWECPRLGPEELRLMPSLRAVVHAAGTVKPIVHDAWWERGLQVSSAAAANALPVAEFTVATILLAGKQVGIAQRDYRRRRTFVNTRESYPGCGNYGRTVGLLGASAIGRRVAQLLRPFDLDILISDPYLSEAEARALGGRKVDFDELLRRCDVVSLHAPVTPETEGILDRRRLALMRDGSTLINAARGALVDHEALTDELVAGRLHAVLDTTEPEPLPPGSPLYDLPNVLLTPHIAGSVGNEIRRLGDTALAELGRYTRGEHFAHPVSPDTLPISA
ncbi:hydroxyacid dehydrogenase [Streptomyces sp. NBC_00988]|uniref:hydroxyacid dehydrogenase n=1 Tax=Streptomyces sp. NBC_00988 TaxID=2903704 RepID=UPI003866FDAB|nr:hydroxyacid dehydrogenase [Streptomyces sp. NBC_00988]